MITLKHPRAPALTSECSFLRCLIVETSSSTYLQSLNPTLLVCSQCGSDQESAYCKEPRSAMLVAHLLSDQEHCSGPRSAIDQRRLQSQRQRLPCCHMRENSPSFDPRFALRFPRYPFIHLFIGGALLRLNTRKRVP